MQISTSGNFYDYSKNSSKETKNSNSLTQNSSISNTDEKENKQTQNVNGVELDAKQLQQLRELQNTDRNVKAHEAAHMAAGGGLAGAASFTYTRGPDNQMYAVAGEVPIRMQKGRTPEETIANARQVVAAAMAPADPSPQDYKVAANATKMEFEARAEAMKIKAEEAQKEKEEKQTTDEENSKDSVNSKNFKNDTENNDEKFKNFIAKTYQQNSQNYDFDFSVAS